MREIASLNRVTKPTGGGDTIGTALAYANVSSGMSLFYVYGTINDVSRAIRQTSSGDFFGISTNADLAQAMVIRSLASFVCVRIIDVRCPSWSNGAWRHCAPI